MQNHINICWPCKMLRFDTPQAFSTRLLDKSGYTLTTEAREYKFLVPASSCGITKLYELEDQQAPLYVGIAHQPKSASFCYGFRADDKGSYHGYKWKTLRHTFRLTGWTTPTLAGQAFLCEMETVETDLLAPSSSWEWSHNQHEIQFYPSEEKHRSAMKTKYDQATESSVRPPAGPTKTIKPVSTVQLAR